MGTGISVRRWLAALTVLFVVLSVLPPGVFAADGGPTTVVLDSSSHQVARTRIDGTEYTVYRVENVLPYASGIEVYADGRPVTDPRSIDPVISQLAARRTLEGVNTTVDPSTITTESDADRQFTVVAWQVAAREVSPRDLRQLRDIRDAAADIDHTVSPPLTATNAVLDVFDRMHTTRILVLGVSVWDVATSAYPELPLYERALRQLQTELGGWNEGAEQVVRNVDPAITSLERAQRGQAIDYTRLSARLAGAAQGLEQLQRKSNQLTSTLTNVSATTSEVSYSLRRSRVPAIFVEPITELSYKLQSTISWLRLFTEALQSSGNQLAFVHRHAPALKRGYVAEWRSDRSSYRSQWHARQTAETRVYGTFGGVGLGVVGLLLYGRLGR